MVTATKSVDSIVVCNKGLKYGSVYWEIFCPLPTANNVSVGFIRDGYDIKKTIKENEQFMKKIQVSHPGPLLIGIKLDIGD